MTQPAVGVDDKPAGVDVLKRAPDPGGDQLRALHGRRLDVDHAEAEGRRPGVLLDQPQVFQALAGEFEHELVDPRLEHRGEQEVVVALPGRPGVAVAVADVQRPGDRHAVGDDVHRLDRQGRLLRVAREERLVDLQEPRPRRPPAARASLLSRLRQGADERRPGSVRAVADGNPPGQRERAGEGELHRAVGQRAGELEVGREAESRQALRAGGARGGRPAGGELLVVRRAAAR